MASKSYVEIKDRLPSSMQDDLVDNQEDYHSFTHEYRCDLLSTIKVKYNSKRAATQINKIAYAREASLSDSNGYITIL